MRNKSQIKSLERMIRKVEKEGNPNFISKDYYKIFGYIGTMDFATMKKLGFLKVVNVEYYDVEVDKISNKIFAVKGNEKIQINDWYREKRFAEKLGYEIVVEENYVDTVKGKRYTYQFDIDKMKKEYNESVVDYMSLKKRQAKNRIDIASRKVENLSRRLTAAERDLDETICKFNHVNFMGDLQLM